MCNKNNPVTTTVSSKPERRSRTKRRKPKYLSLKLELSSRKEKPIPSKPNKKPTEMPHKQQLNLFPLHPENRVQEKDTHDDHVADHVAFLFETATDDNSTTLHGLLDTTSTTATTTTTSDEAPLSPSLTNGYQGHDGEETCCGGSSSLVRTAMRCKERDPSEERWVSYWEVVEKKDQEEVTSNCCAAADSLRKIMQMQGEIKGLVGLKLDYQQVMNAWSDKGPLYIERESPQTVPDLQDGSSALMEGWGSLWRVPEMGSMKKREKEEWKLGKREASVMRYKEKRQSRLFSKRIRYQVRKLNAEKRPRLKGRFVKRSGEV